MIGSHLTIRALLPAAALFAALAPAAEPPAPSSESPSAEDRYHPLQLADGQETVNDRCPVRKRRLNAKLEPLWVNGRPVGFC